MDSDIGPYRNRYFAMRHGHSLANQAGIIVSAPEIGIAGFGLSLIGERQVRHSAERFEPPPGPLRIYCSDFLRARQTAELVQDIVHAPGGVRQMPLLRERYFGQLEGLADDHYASVWTRDALDPSHGDFSVESVIAVVARLKELLQTLERRHEGDTILLVAHGDVLQILQTVFDKLPCSEHRQLSHLGVAEIRRLV